MYARLSPLSALLLVVETSDNQKEIDDYAHRLMSDQEQLNAVYDQLAQSDDKTKHLVSQKVPRLFQEQ